MSHFTPIKAQLPSYNACWSPYGLDKFGLRPDGNFARPITAVRMRGQRCSCLSLSSITDTLTLFQAALQIFFIHVEEMTFCRRLRVRFDSVLLLKKGPPTPSPRNRKVHLLVTVGKKKEGMYNKILSIQNFRKSCLIVQSTPAEYRNNDEKWKTYTLHDNLFFFKKSFGHSDTAQNPTI